jgi:hypothetical protein
MGKTPDATGAGEGRMRSTIVAAVAGILLATMPITSAHSESVFLVGPTADCNPTFRPTGRVDYACKSNRDILDFERGVQISCTAPISIGWQSKPGAGGFRPIAYAHIEPQCRSRSLQPPISARTNIYASAVPPADRTGSVLWLYSPSPSPEVAVCVSPINYNLEGACGKAKFE